VLTLVLLQSSAQPVIGPAAPPGAPDLGRELYLTAGHLVGFSLLTALWWWAFTVRLSSSRALVLAVLIALSLGVVTEIAQTLVADRSASAFDMAANAVSALAAAWVIERLQ
jgi:VanZ family protein